MKNATGRATTVAAMTGATLLVSSAAAFGAGTFVTVGGDATPRTVAASGTNDGTLNFVTDWNVPASCEEADITGEIEAGIEVTDGNIIGTVTELTFTDCVATGLEYPVVIEHNTGTEWDFEVVGDPTGPGAPVDILIKDVSAYMHSTGTPNWTCELDATGDVPATFDPATQQIEIDSDSTFPLALQAYDGTGTKTPTSSGTCGGQIYTGDSADMVGDFDLTTAEGPVTH